MSETGELVLGRDRLLHPGLDAFRRPDLVEHLHRPVGGAAVQRTFQRPEARRHRRVHVGECGGRDARGERRGVEPMFGLQDETGVEDLRGLRIRVEAGHLHEVRRVAERRVGRDGLLTASPADVRREDRRKLRGQTDRFGVLGFA